MFRSAARRFLTAAATAGAGVWGPRVNLHARFSSDSVKICVQDQISLTGSTRALMQVNPPPRPLSPYGYAGSTETTC